MVQLHHIVGGHGKRTQHETVESVIALCWYCHHGTNGWHGKNSLSIKTKLRLDLQDKYKQKGHTKEEVRVLMGGRLYADPNNRDN